MKKIELIKEYQGKKAGFKTELRRGRADYLIRMGIAREVDESGEKKLVNKPNVTKGGSKEVSEPTKTEK